MQTELMQYIEALPEEFRRETTGDELLASLGESLGMRRPPDGRLRRLWAIGSIEARILLGMIAVRARATFVSSDERQRLLDEQRLANAIRVLAGMSYLRGPIMKLGQLIASYPTIAPRQYVELLEHLQCQAPPMHFSLLREIVRQDLGDEPESLFAEFETSAFASASLGQVHRARLHSGQPVAVKIQYPNIARTIRSDLRNLNAALFPLRLTGDWDNIRAQIAVVERMLEQETDYRQEAMSMAIARRVFHEEDDIVVPRAYEQFCSGRVLTMDLLPGNHLSSYLARHPSRDLRHQHAHRLSVAMFRLFYREQFVFADPHPGNFLFMPDGRLGLIDFGCCHVFTPEEQHYINMMERHARADPVDWRQAILDGAPLTERQRRDEQRLILSESLLKWLWEPLLHDGEYDFADETYIRRGFDVMSEFAGKRYLRQEPVTAWLGRFFVGYRVMLHRLAVQLNVRAIHRRESEGSRF